MDTVTPVAAAVKWAEMPVFMLEIAIQFLSVSDNLKNVAWVTRQWQQKLDQCRYSNWVMWRKSEPEFLRSLVRTMPRVLRVHVVAHEVSTDVEPLTRLDGLAEVTLVGSNIRDSGLTLQTLLTRISQLCLFSLSSQLLRFDDLVDELPPSKLVHLGWHKWSAALTHHPRFARLFMASLVHLTDLNLLSPDPPLCALPLFAVSKLSRLLVIGSQTRIDLNVAQLVMTHRKTLECLRLQFARVNLFLGLPRVTMLKLVNCLVHNIDTLAYLPRLDKLHVEAVALSNPTPTSCGFLLDLPQLTELSMTAVGLADSDWYLPALLLSNLRLLHLGPASSSSSPCLTRNGAVSSTARFVSRKLRVLRLEALCLDLSRIFAASELDSLRYLEIVVCSCDNLEWLRSSVRRLDKLTCLVVGKYSQKSADTDQLLKDLAERVPTLVVHTTGDSLVFGRGKETPMSYPLALELCASEMRSILSL